MTAPFVPILARTEHLVVVGKPSGLMVHRSDQYRGDRWYAVQLVRDLVGAHVWPVHRLDRGASGCLLFALDAAWARTLQESLNADDAVKTYLAFVRGTWRREGEVVVDNPMKDDQGVLREARSTVRGIATSAEPRCSLLHVRPETGRYHQVRRHVRDLNHPVIADHDHGDLKFNRAFRESWGLERLGLHCLSLDLRLPEGRLEVTCPVPPDLRDVLARMPWWDEARAALPALDLPWPSEPA